jgi:hypothetical protein
LTDKPFHPAMKIEFKKRLIRTLLWITAGFVVLFVFRFVYGYTTGLSEVREEYFSDFLSDVDNVKRNYASSSYKYDKAVSHENGAAYDANVQHAGKQVSVDQKYEKIATIKSRSEKFKNDEKVLREKIKSTNSIIQYEENVGQEGDRKLHLLIGVPPEKFDSLYAQLLAIGKIASKEITKIDKTNEFANLNAKKASLETTRQSLIDIKKRSGDIDEYINLQNRILQIEQELQSLGVLLGDFDTENEFCTIRFSLQESRIITIGMLHRVKVAFEWAVQYYLIFVAILALASVFAFFFLLIIDKVIPSIVSRINQ